MDLYTKERAWADQLERRLIEVAAHHCCKVDDKADRSQNTDVIFTWKPVSLRVRRHGWLDRYPFDITFRASLPSGVPTELYKLLHGHGELMVYGHANEAATDIVAWVVIDLKELRAWWLGKLINEGCHPGQHIHAPNATFRAIDTRTLPEGCVIETFGLPEAVAN